MISPTEKTILELEADVLQTFSKFTDTVSQYSDAFHLMQFDSDHIYQVTHFFGGLESLRQSLDALIEASRILASLKGIKLPD
jgi:hypothetical protein